MDTDTVALISVGGTVLVSLFSILVPTYVECKRSKRERAATERIVIRDAAAELLRNLANFRQTEGDERAESAGLESALQAVAEMRASYDLWGLAVWPWLSQDQRSGVSQIREKKLGSDNLKKEALAIAQQVFTWTGQAMGKVR